MTMKISTKHLFLSRFLTEYKNNCWPPTMKRRKKANQLAESIEIQNASTSRIYCLPPELVLDIAERMQPSDKYCLRLVCRRYALLLYDVQNVNMGVHEWEALKERLVRDVENERSFKLAEEERQAELFCLISHATHPKRMFTAAEMLRSPHIPECHGANLTFRLCSHYYLTHDQMKPRMPHWRFEQSWDCCTRLQNFADDTWRVSGNPTKTNIGGNGDLTIVDIQQHLKQLAQPLCPHLHTDGIYVQQSIQENNWRLQKIPCKESRLPVYIVYTSFIRCLVENCETTLMICSHERTIST